MTEENEPNEVDKLVESIKDQIQTLTDDAYEAGVEQGYDEMYDTIQEDKVKPFRQWVESLNTKVEPITKEQILQKFNELFGKPDNSVAGKDTGKEEKPQ